MTTDAEPSLDALIEEEIRASKPAPDCSVKVFLEGLNDADRTSLIRWLARPSKDAPTSAIFRVLRKRGFPRTDQAVAKHRRGTCSCRSTTN